MSNFALVPNEKCRRRVFFCGAKSAPSERIRDAQFELIVKNSSHRCNVRCAQIVKVKKGGKLGGCLSFASQPGLLISAVESHAE